MVSTDGYRLALCREKSGNSTEARIIIPGKALTEIAKLAKGYEAVTLRFNHRFVSASLGNYQLTSRLLEGEFLDYVQAIPKAASTTVLAPTKALIESVARTRLMVSDSLKSPLRVKFSDNLIRLSTDTSMGKAYDEVPCTITGEELEIGFNAQYLLDALQTVSEDQIKMEMVNSLSPMKITPSDGDRYLFLVLPVRMKTA